MSVKRELLALAEDIKNRYASISGSDPNETLLNTYADCVAFVTKIASDEAQTEVVSSKDLMKLAAIAESFDASGDADLQREAGVIDELLLTLAAPKDAVWKINQVYDAELERLYEDWRGKKVDELYHGPKRALDEMHGNKAIAEAVKEQVKRFRPLEAPLSTRYSPDYPGVQLLRITDRVYQDPVTGKIYNYEAGYKTNKGNEVPGGGVEYQTQTLTDQPASMFTTRESINGR